MKKVMIVFGSGGHTTEMLLMLKQFKFNDYKHVYFVLGHSDDWSLTKIRDTYMKMNIDIDDERKVTNLTIERLFRSREVKQSYFTSIFTTLGGLAHAIWMIGKYRPDLVRYLIP